MLGYEALIAGASFGRAMVLGIVSSKAPVTPFVSVFGSGSARVIPNLIWSKMARIVQRQKSSTSFSEGLLRIYLNDFRCEILIRLPLGLKRTIR